MRTALYFCLNDEYMAQFNILKRTLLKYGNVPSDVDWFVFTPDIVVREIENVNIVRTNNTYKKDFDGEPFQNCPDKLFGMNYLESIGYDQAVYLDCDVIVCGDISELFKQTDFDIAACNEYYYPNAYKDCPVYKDTIRINSRYFNSGVMVINLKSKCVNSEISNYDRSNDILPERVWRDQEILNWKFSNSKIKNLPKKYNWKPEGYAPLSEDDFKEHINDRSNASIIHFAGKAKPWKPYPITAFSFEIMQAPKQFYDEIISLL